MHARAVQKYAHERLKGDSTALQPLLKIYNYLCGQDLELKLFTPRELMLSVHAPPPTTEKATHVFLSSDSADFILTDFRLRLDLSLTIHLSSGHHKFLH